MSFARFFALRQRVLFRLNQMGVFDRMQLAQCHLYSHQYCTLWQK